MPSLVEIGPVVLERKMKMWKVYRRTTDNRRSEKPTWPFSSGELLQNISPGIVKRITHTINQPSGVKYLLSSNHSFFTKMKCAASLRHTSKFSANESFCFSELAKNAASGTLFSISGALCGTSNTLCVTNGKVFYILHFCSKRMPELITILLINCARTLPYIHMYFRKSRFPSSGR